MAAFSISPQTGDLHLGDDIALKPHDARQSVEPAIAHWLRKSRDMGNGYVWLNLGDLFSGQPAALALCFKGDRLTEASWSVQLPGAPVEDGWPTREAIDAEVAFVRSALAKEMGLASERQSWGSVWSAFDPKGFMASHGLRYA
jgi:hypothetical protein